MKESQGRKRHGVLMVLAVVFGMAPTVGDIGSCGQSPDPLDARVFFDVKAHTDCRRCDECGLGTHLCTSACDDPPAVAFPDGCSPLVHDGEVCLQALLHASCDDFASYVDDNAPSAPSECLFCPVKP